MLAHPFALASRGHIAFRKPRPSLFSISPRPPLLLEPSPPLSQIVGAVSHHPFLRHVDLSHNAFGRRAAMQMRRMLRNSRSLTSFKAVGVGLCSEHLAILAPSLSKNVRLTSLDLSANQFGVSDREGPPAVVEGEEGQMEVVLPVEVDGGEPALLSARALALVFELNIALSELRLANAGLEQPAEVEEVLVVEEEEDGQTEEVEEGEEMGGPATKTPAPPAADKPAAKRMKLGDILGEGLSKAMKSRRVYTPADACFFRTRHRPTIMYTPPHPSLQLPHPATLTHPLTSHKTPHSPTVPHHSTTPPSTQPLHIPHPPPSNPILLTHLPFTMPQSHMHTHSPTTLHLPSLSFSLPSPPDRFFPIPVQSHPP